MPLIDIPGQEHVISRFGPCSLCDFNEVRILSVETYYEENREAFEKMLSIILKGPKGTIQLSFGNVTDFKISNINQISGFDVIDIRDRGLENKRFEILDYEDSSIEGFSEIAQISICDSPYT